MFLKENLIYFSKFISINELAKKAKCDQTTLNKIMNGTSPNPTIQKLLIIFEELKTKKLVNSFDDLIFKNLKEEERCKK